MSCYYYVVFTLRRLSGASGANNFREWRARVVLLWIEIQLVLTVLYLLAPKLFAFASPIIGGMIIAVPLFVVNQVLLADVNVYRRYSRDFSNWSSTKRRTADFGVVLLLLMAFIAPFFARSLMTKRPWWQ